MKMKEKYAKMNRLKHKTVDTSQKRKKVNNRKQKISIFHKTRNQMK